VNGRTLIVLVLGSACVGALKADSVVCSVSSGMGPLVTQSSCNQSFVSNDFMNWGAPVSSGGLGEALSPPSDLGPALVTTQLGVGISVTSNEMLERADNTDLAWDAGLNEWVAPTVGNGFAENINTFMGNFDAPSMPTYAGNNGPAYGPNNYPYQFGDPLLGAVPGQYANPGPFVGLPLLTQPIMTFSFNQPLYGVAFRVSSETNPDFTAVLDAYDSSGDLLGVYQVNDTGDGGICSSLSNASGPVPCNGAPIMQFYDPEGRIASVVLTLEGDTGEYVDGLSLLDGPQQTGAPEPASAALIGGGLIILALASRRFSAARTGLRRIARQTN
jgi:hypothetical protein